MLLRLFLLTIVAGIFEVWLLVRVAQATSFFTVFALVVLSFVAGVSLFRTLGARTRARMALGKEPTPESMGSVLITAIAAILLILPGIASDFCAALMMLPFIHERLARRMGSIAPVNFQSFNGFGGPFGASFHPPNSTLRGDAQDGFHRPGGTYEQTTGDDWRQTPSQDPTRIILDAEIVDESERGSR